VKGQSKKLLPGMTVSCKIHIQKIANVTFVPLDAVFKEGLQRYVYIKSGGNFIRKDIKPGIENNDFVVVEEGLNPGDYVALLYPFEVEPESKTDNESQN
jgi:HlyD family secretion protein